MQYWASTGLIVPSHTTPGGHARYTFQDLVSLKTSKKLLGAGVSVQRIRKVIDRLKGILPKVKRPLSDLTLVTTDDLVLVFYENTVFEAITGQQWILELSEVQRDIDKWEKRLKNIKKYRVISQPSTPSQKTGDLPQRPEKVYGQKS